MARFEQNHLYVPAVMPPEAGVCMSSDVDSDLFYPRTDGELMQDFERRNFLAKQLCRTCTEQVICMTVAIEYEAPRVDRNEQRAPLGIRAATTDEERRLRRRQRKQPFSGR